MRNANPDTKHFCEKQNIKICQRHVAVDNVKAFLLQYLINFSYIFSNALSFVCYNMNGITSVFKLTDTVIIIDVLRDDMKFKLLRMLKMGSIVQ